MAEGLVRTAWAEIDLGAVAHNVRWLRALVAPARLCVVVKADAYGHGAVAVARAALDAGAVWLAVALVEEGLELRRAGIDAPVLLLSEPSAGDMAEAVAGGLTPTVYRPEGVAAASAAAASAAAASAGAASAGAVSAGASSRAAEGVGVHLKVDTGMHRVGADPGEALGLAQAVAEAGPLRLEGLWSHLAVADQPEDPFTGEQIRRFQDMRAQLARAGLSAEWLHLANSAGAIAHPASRLQLVRCGIAVYGYPPVPTPGTLLPVLSLRSRVSFVRRLATGERVSYGRRRPLAETSWVATVPIGYADGVRRGLFDAGMAVLIRGRRRPLAGTVTMDQIMVDVGPSGDVAVDDEVVLLGRQGPETISAEDWARALGTISYEVLCGIGSRVPRAVV